jgi:hypothetical protein
VENLQKTVKITGKALGHWFKSSRRHLAFPHNVDVGMFSSHETAPRRADPPKSLPYCVIFLRQMLQWIGLAGIPSDSL